MKRKYIFLSLMLVLLVAGTAITVKATGSIRDYFTKTAEIGQFTNDWDFYYKNEGGEVIELTSFANGGPMEPIVYNGIIYLRSGFLMEELGFGGTLDRDNQVMTLFHPVYKDEGETDVHYNTDEESLTEEEVQEKEKEIKEAEENLSKEELFAIVEHMDDVNADMLDISDLLYDFMYDEVERQSIIDRFDVTLENMDALQDYLYHPIVLSFAHQYDETVGLANDLLNTKNPQYYYEYVTEVFNLSMHIYEMNMRIELMQ